MKKKFLAMALGIAVVSAAQHAAAVHLTQQHLHQVRQMLLLQKPEAIQQQAETQQ